MTEEEYELFVRLQLEAIHQKAEKIDKETTAFIKDYLEKNPDVKELWEKEKGDTNGIHED